MESTLRIFGSLFGIAWNAAIAIALYMAIVRGNVEAQSLAVLMIWLGFGCSLLLLSPRLLTKVVDTFKPSPATQVLEIAAHLLITMILAYHLWVFSALVYFAYFVVLQRRYHPLSGL